MTNLATVSHKDFFNAPAVKARFQEVLHGKENEFVASLLSVVNYKLRREFVKVCC